MAFTCTCNHTRGKHDNADKDSSQVGKCNAVLGQDQTNKPIVCTCTKYKGISRNGNRDYINLFLYKSLTAILLFALVMIVISKYDSHGLGGFFAMVAWLIIWYYSTIEPFNVKVKQERLE